MSKDVAKDLKINVGETLTLKPNEATEVIVENTGKRTLTYKLKTTRPSSVKPNKAFGVVKSNGKDAFKVNYKPTPDEKPFGEIDRVTLLVGFLPDSFKQPEHYWKTPNAASDAHRSVLKLEKAADEKTKEKEKEKEPKKKKEAKESEKEEDVKSEESEAETESGTESGTESEA